VERAPVETQAERDARNRLEQQRKDEAARLEREALDRQRRQAAEQELAPERQAVLNVLRSYADSYARKDKNQIRALWPTIPRESQKAIDDAFRDFREISIRLQPVSDPEIAGAKATVRCRLLSDSVDRNGAHSNQSTVIITLVKVRGSWVIDSMKYL
jgi:hypothetical protein